MTTSTDVLIIGAEPELIDYSSPALPPGMNAEKVRAGLARGREKLAEAGIPADLCLVDLGATAEATIAKALAAKSYRCVVIGAGIRALPAHLLLFEKVVNAVHRHAPGATIAFNTSPEDSAAAARRWL
jgi:hypothetical protein